MYISCWRWGWSGCCSLLNTAAFRVLAPTGVERQAYSAPSATVCHRAQPLYNAAVVHFKFNGRKVDTIYSLGKLYKTETLWLSKWYFPRAMKKFRIVVDRHKFKSAIDHAKSLNLHNRFCCCSGGTNFLLVSMIQFRYLTERPTSHFRQFTNYSGPTPCKQAGR